MNNNREQMSKTRKVYFLRFAGRIAVLIIAFLVYIYSPEAFDVADGWEFFSRFSPVHLLWIIWMCDMILQLIPVRLHISIGSQKVFKSLFRPIKEKTDHKHLKQYIKNTTASAYKVMVLWIVLTALISVLHISGRLDAGMMVLIATVFYVCDLICVLIWCPFRLIMGNKCCTTCRIFNWDRLMMFLPIVALNSFFSWTLVLVAFGIWIVWELCVFLHPERFWEKSNMALRCSECSDKLCTQYCRKLRK